MFRSVYRRHNRESTKNLQRKRSRASLRLEQLEDRNLLSVFTPAQIRKAYQINQLSYTGSGQTIAIVDAYNDPTIAADLATFDSQFGLAAPPKLQVVNQTGGSSLPAFDADWSIETSLDVEWAHAVAPGANILLVEANSASYSDLLAAVDYAAAHAGVVSMSWGSDEFSAETGSSYDGHFANHPGVTFVAASGDYGAPPGWPAVSPNVVAVGGTTLSTYSDGTWYSERGWGNGGWSFYFGGSGGGISAYEPKPSYQGSVTQSASHRTNPDVAFNANPNTGFYVYDGSNGGWWSVGGTSAGAPQWAALVALADQGRMAGGKANLGSSDTLNAIYTMPSSNFHDITSGSNGYSATPGYDLVTGRGSPYANQVVNYLVGYGSSSSTATALATSSSKTTVATKGNGRTVVNTQAVIILGNQALLGAQVATSVIPVPAPAAGAIPVNTSARTNAQPAFPTGPASTATPSMIGHFSAALDAVGDDGPALPFERIDDAEPVVPMPATDDNEAPAAPADPSSALPEESKPAADAIPNITAVEMPPMPVPPTEVAPPRPVADGQFLMQPASALAAAAIVFGTYWQPEFRKGERRRVPASRS